jgi:proteasome lid subunit RPN8/RPN11
VPQNEVDVSQIEVDSLSEKAFPVKHPFRIHISEETHADIWKHARETLLDSQDVKEVGGVLVGNIYKDSQGPFIDVKAAIRAEHTRNEGTEVAFTPETWDQVNTVKDESYPDDRIVGWYHTHPRFGIFLSERDKFIQHHSFPQPWTIAFVLDPVQETEGFFFWSKGDPTEAKEYWIGQEHRQYIEPKQGQNADNDDSGSSEELKAAASQASFAFSFTIALLSLLFAFGYTYWKGAQQAQRDKLILKGVESQQAELDRSFQSVVLLKSAVNQAKDRAAPDKGITPAAPDPQIPNRILEIETGLRRMSVITRVLEAAVAGKDIHIVETSEGNATTNQRPETSAPEANKQ